MHRRPLIQEWVRAAGMRLMVAFWYGFNFIPTTMMRSARKFFPGAPRLSSGFLAIRIGSGSLSGGSGTGVPKCRVGFRSRTCCFPKFFFQCDEEDDLLSWFFQEAGSCCSSSNHQCWVHNNLRIPWQGLPCSPCTSWQ
jgi:hypothetical protein